jgi:hypothetical protein
VVTAKKNKEAVTPQPATTTKTPEATTTTEQSGGSHGKDEHKPIHISAKNIISKFLIRSNLSLALFMVSGSGISPAEDT